MLIDVTGSVKSGLRRQVELYHLHCSLLVSCGESI